VAKLVYSRNVKVNDNSGENSAKFKKNTSTGLINIFSLFLDYMSACPYSLSFWRINVSWTNSSEAAKSVTS